MASVNAEVKEVNLTLKPQELDLLLDALTKGIEEIETGNDDLSLITLNINGKLPFYKVEKSSDPYVRKWLIKYNRLYQQLSRVNNNILKLRKRR